MINLWKHQKECVDKKNEYDKCLINCWCGTGKTRIFTHSILNEGYDLSVIVFPSLGLINQYSFDYVNNEKFQNLWDKFEILSFCSVNDEKINLRFRGKKIKYTVYDRMLKTFLKNRCNKLITVTYQSFEKFVNIIKNMNMNIDYLVYDEAHHTVGSQIQEIVYNDIEFEQLVNKTEFYTATPINRNGIVMYDKDEPENSDCGPIAYEYLYYQALNDGISRKYDVVLNISVKKENETEKYRNVFETIVRNCLSGDYDYWNILTFHSGVEETENRSNSVVKEFCNKHNVGLFKKIFTKIQNNEFPETKDKFNVKNVIFKGIHSKTPKRDEILSNFDRKVTGRIYILSSCRTVGEGIDTKWANMEIPVDPTKSIVYESQKIGRITRKPEENMNNSCLVLPVAVDREKYSKAVTQEQKDELIRKELDEGGDFNTFLNIVSAFKYQYDPEIYELCLKYPNMYSPDEVKNSLKYQGLTTYESQGSIVDNINYLLDVKHDFKDCIEEDNKNTIENIAYELNKPIEVHTQNYDQPIEYYNEYSIEEPLHLFCDENGIYYPVKQNEKKGIKNIIPSKKRDKLFKIRTDSEFQILWNIDDNSLINFENGLGKGTLDCSIKWNIKNWYNYLENVKQFMDKENMRPNSRSKNEDEKKLGRWIGTQLKNYKKGKYIMKDEKIRQSWEEFINDSRYKQYFLSNEEIWYNNLENVKQFMDKEHIRPNSMNKNEDEKKLGIWLGTQLNNYKKGTYIMKDEKIKQSWEEFINDSRYKQYFLSNEEIWYNYLENVKQFMDKEHMRPNSMSKNEEEKKLGI